MLHNFARCARCKQLRLGTAFGVCAQCWRGRTLAMRAGVSHVVELTLQVLAMPDDGKRHALMKELSELLDTIIEP